MTPTEYYTECRKEIDKAASKCAWCEAKIGLWIIEQEGKTRVNPYCEKCQLEHVLDAEGRVLRVVFFMNNDAKNQNITP